MQKILLTLAIILVAGCGSSGYQSAAAPVHHSASRHTPASAYSADLLAIAQRQIGVPYRYGGYTPRQGFDCSGLMHFVHARAGIQIPRATREQYRRSRPVALAAIRPGDLLFFRMNGDKPNHVGLYTGGGRFIHAPSSGKTVSESSLQNDYWHYRLIAAGRFI